MSNDFSSDDDYDDSRAIFPSFLSNALNRNKQDLLSVDEQKELGIRMINGDDNAKQELINHSLRLVASRAYRYSSYAKGLEIKDLFSMGYLGLYRACDKYDPEKGAFSTYAIPWIDHSIRRGINRSNSVIQIPFKLDMLIHRYSSFTDKYFKENGEMPDDETICKSLDISKKALERIRDGKNDIPLSMDTCVSSESDMSLLDFISNDDAVTDDNILDSDVFDSVVDKLYDSYMLGLFNRYLSDKEFFVIYYRYVIDKNYKLEDVGDFFFVTRQRIQQIEAKGLEKIKPILIKNAEGKSKIDSYASEEFKCKDGPISIDSLIAFYELFDSLSDNQKKYYILKYLDKRILPDKYICSSLGVDEKEYGAICSDVCNLRTNFLCDNKRYENSKNKFLAMYRANIFDYRTNLYTDYIGYFDTIMEDSDMCFDDYQKKYNLNILNEKERTLLGKYFEVTVKSDEIDPSALSDINEFLSRKMKTFEGTFGTASFTQIPKDRMSKFLKIFGNFIPENSIKSLQEFYEIQNRDIMRDSEVHHVFDLMKRLIIQKEDVKTFKKKD